MNYEKEIERIINKNFNKVNREGIGFLTTEMNKCKTELKDLVKKLNIPSVLNETIEYIEQTTKEIEDEWGSSRSLQEIKDAKDMPDIYYKLIALKNGE